MDQSQGKKQMNELPFIPLGIIFKILLYLPAEFLYECVRLVSDEWASIICDSSFIKAHLRKSKGGLLFQSSSQLYHEQVLDPEILWSPTYLRFFIQGIPLASCRGICLFLSQNGKYTSLYPRGRDCFAFTSYPCRPLYVLNPVTGQFQVLPSPGKGFYKFLHIVYIEQSSEFKVVCLFSNSRDSWLVFTLGIDMSWRILAAMHTANILGKKFGPTSAAVGQFVYLSCREGILAINLCDESVSSIQCPKGVTFRFCFLRKLGDNLSLVMYEKRKLQLRIWMLRDLETCEWVRVPDIEDVAERNKNIRIYNFFPIGWLDNTRTFVIEMIPFSDDNGIPVVRAFNAETGKVFFYRYWDYKSHSPCIIHTNSLVKW